MTVSAPPAPQGSFSHVVFTFFLLSSKERNSAQSNGTSIAVEKRFTFLFRRGLSQFLVNSLFLFFFVRPDLFIRSDAFKTSMENMFFHLSWSLQFFFLNTSTLTAILAAQFQKFYEYLTSHRVCKPKITMTALYWISNFVTHNSLIYNQFTNDQDSP